MFRDLEPVQLGTIEVFCKAADLGSFTAAAEALGLTQGTVSRAIARLEARLGARLFQRSTRRVALTPEGELYRQHCQQALEQIAEAERVIGGRQASPRGRLRVSVGTVYGHYRLMPRLPAFMARHPGIELDVDVSNRNIDLVDEGFDLAIRLGEPPDSSQVARKLEDASLGVFAAPAYLQAHGVPDSIESLRSHALIQFVLPSSGRPMPWRLHHAHGVEAPFEFTSRQRVQGDVLAALSWAVAGGGLFQIYHFAAAELVAAGRLVEVLPSPTPPSRPFHVLYPTRQHLSPRVQVFVDFLREGVA